MAGFVTNVGIKMIDLKDKHIKVHFKNGISAEGIVVEWTDTRSVLKSLENEDLLIIHETSQNVMLIRIYMDEIKVIPRINLNQKIVDDDMDEKFIPDPKLHLMKLVELRKLQLQEEKAQVAKKLRKSFVPSGAVKEYYDYPNFAKLKSANGPATQSSRSNDRNNQKLSRLRSKTGQSK